MDTVMSPDRQQLLQRLLDAVKQCQIQFGGKTTLATDADARVSVLCTAWENVLQHGLKHNSRAVSTLKQITEVTGLTRIGSSLIEDLKNLETEPTFWSFIKALLSPHEVQRYAILHHVNTDAGRGRAWLRAALNERTLERSMHRITSAANLLAQYYEDWAFLRDSDKSATLSDMAAGLGSILFAISIDRPELNTIKPASGLNSLLKTTTKQSTGSQSLIDDRCPVASTSSSLSSPKSEARKDRQRKKRPAKIVSFDADDTGNSSSSAVSAVSSAAATPSGTTNNGVSWFGELSGSVDTSLPMSKHVTPDSLSSTMENPVRLSVRLRQCESQALNSQDVNGHTDSSSESYSVLDSEQLSRTDGLCNDNESEKFTVSHSVVGSCPLPEATKVAFFDCPQDYISDDSCCNSVHQGSKHLTDVIAADSESVDSVASVTSGSTPMACSSGPTSSFVASSETSLQPLDADGLPVPLDTVSLGDTSESCGSYDSREMPAYGELIQGASLAVARVQEALTGSQSSWPDLSGQVASCKGETVSNHDSLTVDELKEAVVAMMIRKEEVEEQNKRLQSDFESEKLLVAGLRSEMEQVRHSHTAQLDKFSDKNRTLTRENDVLKHQLKKYVSAVQLLRHQGATAEDFPGIHIEAVQPIIPPANNQIDYSEEALQYEKKLVQVAEMHGELMEFNELLQKQLIARNTQLKHLTDELVALRGPLSGDAQSVEDELISIASDPDFGSYASPGHPLINIWIPSAFLHGSQIDGYHVYQIYLRIRNEEWNVYRRYAEFYELHSKLKRRSPIFSTFEFPPKKAFGKKDPKIVEVRRKMLQSYLRRVVGHLCQDFTELINNPCRETVMSIIPFFSDAPSTEKKSRGRKSRSRGTVSGVGQSTVTGGHSGQHYMGL